MHIPVYAASSKPTVPRNARAVFGLVAFTSFMGCVPLILHWRHKRLQQGGTMWASDQPLNSTAARRGVYLNTSGKDVGPDPDWNAETGSYKGRKSTIVDASAPDAPSSAPS